MFCKQLPHAVNYGHEVDINNKLQPKLMNQGVSAPKLLNELTCACTDNMCNATCTCVLHDQLYSTACKCMETLPFSDEVYSEAWCTNPLTISALTMLIGTDESDNNESQAMTWLNEGQYATCVFIIFETHLLHWYKNKFCLNSGTIIKLVAKGI